MARSVVRFYYDIGSPYSYIAAHRIGDLAAARGVEVTWRPFLLGGVFRAAGNTMPAAVPARGRYMLTDLQRWAAREKVPFIFSSSFPHNTLLAMRVLTAAGADELVPLSMKLFRAAWAEDRNVADEAVLAEILTGLGQDAASVLEAAKSPEVAEKYKQNQTDAIDLGVVGSPCYVLNGEPFWGQDRLDLLDDALASGRGPYHPL